MALDARTRSSIYGKLVGVLGEHDANMLMSEFRPWRPTSW